MKKRKMNYSHLWGKNTLSQSIDDICQQADLSESIMDYSQTLLSGMENILGSNLQTSMKSNKVFMQKIYKLGEDLCDKFSVASNTFCIGLLYSLNIRDNLYNISFFRLIKQLLLNLKNTNIPLNTKRKLVELTRQKRSDLFSKYFLIN